MFNFFQGARGNVGKANQTGRFTPTHTPHTWQGAESTKTEKK